MVLAWVSGCSREEKLEPVVPPVQTIVLSTTSEVPFRRFPGEVAAADTSNMSFDVPGRLIEFPATQGMVYKFGELLGRLDETNFVARVDAARAEFNTAHNELARRRQLHQRGVISRSELDGFQRANDVAEAALREAQRALDDTRLLAPFDGRVARTLVSNFQNVQAHQPVLVFQSTSILEVDIQVPETDMSLAERGITARNARDLLEARAEFPTIPNRQFDLELKSFRYGGHAVRSDLPGHLQPLPARRPEHPSGHDLHRAAAADQSAHPSVHRGRRLSSAYAGGFDW